MIQSLKEEVLKEFDEKSTVMDFDGGLSSLMDYAPYHKILDEKSVKSFLSSAIDKAYAVGREDACAYFEKKMPFCTTQNTFGNVLRRISEEVRTNNPN